MITVKKKGRKENKLLTLMGGHLSKISPMPRGPILEVTLEDSKEGSVVHL